MIFDFLSAIFLGGALFKDACDKTASDRNFETNQRLDEHMRQMEIDRKNQYYKEVESNPEYNLELQDKFLELYVYCKKRFINPKGELCFENMYAVLQPNMDVLNGTREQRLKKCKIDFQRAGYVWSDQFVEDRRPDIYQYVSMNPTAIY